MSCDLYSGEPIKFRRNSETVIKSLLLNVPSLVKKNADAVPLTLAQESFHLVFLMETWLRSTAELGSETGDVGSL